MNRTPASITYNEDSMTRVFLSVAGAGGTGAALPALRVPVAGFGAIPGTGGGPAHEPGPGGTAPGPALRRRLRGPRPARVQALAFRRPSGRGGVRYRFVIPPAK